MSLQEHVTGIADRADKLTFECINGFTSTFGCRVCLWAFETKSELDFHNFLEHMVITHLEEHKRKVEDHPNIQE